MFKMYLIDRLEVFYNFSIVLGGFLILFGTTIWLICLTYLVEIELPKNERNKFNIRWIYAWKRYKMLRIFAYIIVIAIVYVSLMPSKELFDVFIESLKED